MAESNKLFCNVCEAQHITTQANHWCPECEECLCTDCLKHHNASKYTRSHEIISIESYMSLSAYFGNIVQKCEEHGKRLTLYCPQHESLCCTDCIPQRHSQCAGTLGVDEMVKNAKSSTLFLDIERGLRDIKFNIDRISKEKTQNLSRISAQRQQIGNEIKSYRNKINFKLDTMENQLMKDLEAKEKTIKSKIEKLLLELNHRKKSVHKLQDCMRTISHHSTDLQAFFACKSLKESIETEEMYVLSLFEGSKLQQYDLGLFINDQMSEFVSSVKSLGTITCSESSTTIKYHTEKEKQAQIFSKPHKQEPKSIDEINLKLIQEFQMSGYLSKNPFITGCTVHTEGKIILADNNNCCLVVLNEKGKIEGQISTKPSNPWDVTCIDDSRTAVTYNNQAKILLVNIISGTIEKTIPRDNTCFGIQHRDSTLLYYESTKGLLLYNLNTSTTALVVKDETNPGYSRYLAASGNKIYLTPRGNDSLLCYSKTGEKIWKYCNQEVMSRPFGVAVDKNSNVYVASRYNKSVVVISSDGKNGKKLITLQNSVYAIHIDNNDRLLVVDCEGNVTVYKI